MAYNKTASDKYRKVHADKLRQRQTAWREANRPLLRKCHAKYRKANLDKVRRRDAQWKAANRDEIRRRQRENRKANLGRWLTREAARRTRKLAATIGDLVAITKIYERCAELRQWFDVVVDHKIPLNKGGAHIASNLQIIYHFENAAKRDRLDYKPRVIFR